MQIRINATFDYPMVSNKTIVGFVHTNNLTRLNTTKDRIPMENVSPAKILHENSTTPFQPFTFVFDAKKLFYNTTLKTKNATVNVSDLIVNL